MCPLEFIEVFHQFRCPLFSLRRGAAMFPLVRLRLFRVQTFENERYFAALEVVKVPAAIMMLNDPDAGVRLAVEMLLYRLQRYGVPRAYSSLVWLFGM